MRHPNVQKLLGINVGNLLNKTKKLFTFYYEIKKKKIRVPAPIVEGPLPAIKGDMDRIAYRNNNNSIEEVRIRWIIRMSLNSASNLKGKKNKAQHQTRTGFATLIIRVLGTYLTLFLEANSRYQREVLLHKSEQILL